MTRKRDRRAYRVHDVEEQEEMEEVVGGKRRRRRTIRDEVEKPMGPDELKRCAVPWDATNSSW